MAKAALKFFRGASPHTPQGNDSLDPLTSCALIRNEWLKVRPFNTRRVGGRCECGHLERLLNVHESQLHWNNTCIYAKNNVLIVNVL